MQGMVKSVLVNVLKGRCSVWGDVHVKGNFVMHVKLDKRSVLEALKYYEDDEIIDVYVDAQGKVNF